MKEKKRNTRRWMPLLFLLLGLLFPVKTEAADKPCELHIPVRIEVSGENIPGGKTYMVTLEAVTKDAPLPTETVKRRDGAGELKFGPITYTKVGEYQYRISQNTDSAERFTYDRGTYLLNVQVTRQENGTLAARFTAEREGKQEKADAIRFKNQYDAPKSQNSGNSGSHRSTVKAVQTGDTQQPQFWLVTAMLAAGAIAWIVRKEIGKKQGKKERIYRQRMSVYR